MISWLLDTGPLVAVLNRRDPDHQACVEALAPFSGRLLTTGAVATEAMHFLGAAPNGAAALTDFLEGSGTEIRDCFSAQSLRAAARLMKKYADIPMDFADATLVLLAEEAKVADVLTLDERGFRSYRFRGSRYFRLVLDK